MTQDVFKKLQKQLDQYSLGFPATESGIEIEILKRLFSEQDVDMFLNMTPMLETPEQVAGRLNAPAVEIDAKLSDMAARGLLFSLKKGDTIKYGANPFVHGLFEFQTTRIDRDLVVLLKKYLDEEFEKALLDSSASFLRTIPVQHSIDVKHNVAPYEDASEILKKAKKIVVTDCMCRKSANLVDEGCGKPLEVCFMFGSMGQYYLDHNMGRELDIDEALEILLQAQEAGLVTQPASSQNPKGMCNCCGDCCIPLTALNHQPSPAEIVFSNHFAVVDRDLCSSCEICVDRCQMEAIALDEESIAAVNLHRCIGCGLCVITCPDEALTLTPKPADQRQTPPINTREQMLGMAMKRGVL
jgi:Pyruvate/2-oxoacid:ferredoxin oxidoreductase delta subunit